MTVTELGVLVDQYRAGLDAEIVILHRLEEKARRQREASASSDMDALHRAADDRDALMAGLVSIESQLREIRQALSQAKEQAKTLPDYQDAVRLHHEAIALVSRIIRTDEESLEALATAELARREAARAVEQGETTLAAYRRVTATPAGATLVNRRG